MKIMIIVIVIVIVIVLKIVIVILIVIPILLLLLLLLLMIIMIITAEVFKHGIICWLSFNSCAFLSILSTTKICKTLHINMHTEY